MHVGSYLFQCVQTFESLQVETQSVFQNKNLLKALLHMNNTRAFNKSAIARALGHVDIKGGVKDETWTQFGQETCLVNSPRQGLHQNGSKGAHTQKQKLAATKTMLTLRHQTRHLRQKTKNTLQMHLDQMEDMFHVPTIMDLLR